MRMGSWPRTSRRSSPPARRDRRRPGSGLVADRPAHGRQGQLGQFEILQGERNADDADELGHGSDAQAAAYVECRAADGRTCFGVGIDADVATASVKALLSAAITIRTERAG